MEGLIKLVELSYKISNTKVTDVFVDYSPHTNQSSITIYKDGWEHGHQRKSYDVYLDDRYGETRNIIHVNTAIKILEDILNDK